MNDHDPRNLRRRDEVSNFVRMLREGRRMPVSFIQANDWIDMIELKVGDHIEATLDMLVSQVPMYQWSKIVGHCVLYPRDVIWDAQISGAQITNVPRLEAATRFVTQIRTTIPELSDLSEPPMMGDPLSPTYRQQVSLPSTGSILQHLVELLGPDPQIVFTIERTRFGDRVLHFERVPQ
jgi:hypothetical protein